MPTKAKEEAQKKVVVAQPTITKEKDKQIDESLMLTEKEKVKQPMQAKEQK